MKLSTLLFCQNVLKGLTLKVGADDFAEVAPVVVEALADLEAAIHEATPDYLPTPLPTPPIGPPSIVNVARGE